MNLVIYPDPYLKRTAEPVIDFSEKIHNSAQQLIEAMYTYNGVGLAGVQVGMPESIFVMDVSEDKDSPLIVINPHIIHSSTERDDFEEGCLSVPGVSENVRRPIEITLKWQNVDGEDMQKDFDGLAARVIQHEADHLIGRLFIERIRPMRKIFIKKTLKRLEMEYQK